MSRAAPAGATDLQLLLQGARTGDCAAMERLLAVARPDIRRYAMRHCAASGATDDIVQEASIILFRRVAALRDVAAFGGWLVRIVQRLCMRPALRFLRGEPLDLLDDSAAFAHRPDHALRIDVAAAIESLPPAYREAVLLRDFEELTIEEMAHRLGLTRAATKSRIHRARLLVREYLADGSREVAP